MEELGCIGIPTNELTVQHAKTGQDILMLPLTSFLQKKPLQYLVQRVMRRRAKMATSLWIPLLLTLLLVSCTAFYLLLEISDKCTRKNIPRPNTDAIHRQIPWDRLPHLQ